MKRYYKYVVALMLASALSHSCSEKFLDRPPVGVFTESNLANKAGIEGILIGAYAGLNGAMVGGSEVNSFSNWILGSVASDDAYKGTDAGDNIGMTSIERKDFDAALGEFNNRWRFTYDGVARSNDVLRLLANAKDISEADAKDISAQARTLRAIYYFHGIIVFGDMPWIDETTTDFLQPRENLYPKIEDDLKYGFENLPETFGQVGRVNKWAAGSFLAKAYVFQKKWAEAKPLLDDIIANGKTTGGLKYELNAKYHDNFRTATQGKNDPEVILDAQYSVNDAGNAENSGRGEILNYPHNGLTSQPGGCCGFHQPSQNLVNAHKTDPATGLPLLDTFNQSDVTNDQGLTSDQPFTPYAGTLDPRLDHTVGRRGVPYLDWGPHPGRAWIRDQGYGGPYTPKKNVYYKAEEGTLTHNGYWTRGLAANNAKIMRFAEVILMAAETEIELGNIEAARTHINRIRRRAANPEGFVMKADGTPAANYLIKEYTTPFASQDEARKIMRFERRLELAMEGQRFFDLVRWGIAEQVMNEYFAVESTKRQYLGGATFKPRNTLYPVPQFQIDNTKKNGQPTLQQNPGY